MEDSKPRFQTFRIPFHNRMRVIDALLFIQENVDPTLAFRCECKAGRCGTCTVLVNGTPSLACKTPIATGKDALTIEPLSHFRVIRDLVVELSETSPYDLSNIVVKPKDTTEGCARIPEKNFSDFKMASKCIECWACYEACPRIGHVHSNFAGPQQIVSMAQIVLNPLNRINPAKTAVLSQMLNECLLCGKCEKLCPSEIRITELVRKLRQALTVKDRRL